MRVLNTGDGHDDGNEDGSSNEIKTIPSDFSSAVLEAVKEALDDIQVTQNSQNSSSSTTSTTMWNGQLTNFDLPSTSDCQINPTTHEVQIPLKNVRLILSVTRLIQEIELRGQYTADLLLEGATTGLNVYLIVRLASKTVMMFREAVRSLRTPATIPTRRVRKFRWGRLFYVILYGLVIAALISAIYIALTRAMTH